MSKQKGGPREQRLLKAFTYPTTQLYIHFLHAVMPYFDSFNTLLQSEEPLIHILYPSMLKLYHGMFDLKYESYWHACL